MPDAPSGITEWIWYLLLLALGGGGFHGAKKGHTWWRRRSQPANGYGTKKAVEDLGAELKPVLEAIQRAIEQSVDAQREHTATAAALRLEVEKLNGSSTAAMNAIAERLADSFGVQKHNAELLLKLEDRVPRR